MASPTGMPVPFTDSFIRNRTRLATARASPSNPVSFGAGKTRSQRG
jgi:hypothetical protein